MTPYGGLPLPRGIRPVNRLEEPSVQSSPGAHEQAAARTATVQEQGRVRGGDRISEDDTRLLQVS